MRRRRPEVDVVRDDGHDNGRGDEEEREEEVLPEQRHDERVLWDDVGEHQKEDGQRQEDVDAQVHLLAGRRRDVEDEDGDERMRDERYYEVDGVEEKLSLEFDLELPERERFVGAGVVSDVLVCRRRHDVPLDRLVELAQIDALLDNLELVEVLSALL